MTQPHTDDPNAGLSATGRTADQMHPGDAGPGTTYGDPGGTGTAEQEVAEQDADAEPGGGAPVADPGGEPGAQ